MILNATEFVRCCHALGNETRARVFFHLYEVMVPQHVGAISTSLNMRDQLTSLHLKTLQAANLVTSQTQGQFRLYTVDLVTVSHIIDYLETHNKGDSRNETV